MKKNIILGILMLSNLAIAQNEFPQNDDVLIKGKSLRISRPITTGGWEQGVRFFDLNNQNQYAELGMKGTADNSERIFIAHGINDNSANSAWLSKKSINLLRDGKVGIGTTTPNYRLDVQGDFRSQIGNNEFIVKPYEFIFKGNTSGGWTKQLKLGNDNGTPKFAAFGAYGSGLSNKIHFAYIDATGSPMYNNSKNFRVYSNGNVAVVGGGLGVGTTNPLGMLHVGDNSKAGVIFKNRIGEVESIIPAQFAWGESTMGVAGDLIIAPRTDISTSIRFFTNTSNTVSEKMRISGNGNVGIGTINTSDATGIYKLSVKGKVRADEVKVYTGWSDFVFEKDYNLPTLKEVEEHINEKGHLKDIPNAKEVEENGIYLGKINAKLLQKIEELTLYTIQQEKDIKSLNSVKAENEELKQRVDKLEKLIGKLIKK